MKNFIKKIDLFDSLLDYRFFMLLTNCMLIDVIYYSIFFFFLHNFNIRKHEI